MQRMRSVNWSEKLMLLTVFLLPWQTQWIFAETQIGEGTLGTGVMGIFTVELLALIASTFQIARNKEGAAEIVEAIWKPGALLLGATAMGAMLNAGRLPWFHLGHLLVASIFMIAIASFKKKKNLVLALSIGLIVPVLIGACQVFTGYFPPITILGIAERIADRGGDSVLWLVNERILRAYGSFSHPNIFAGYLAVATLLLIGLFGEFKKRGYILAVIVLLGIGLALTYSQLAWAAFILGVAVFFISKTERQAQLWQKWGSTVTAGTVLVGMVALTIMAAQGSMAFKSNSLVERVTQYKIAINIIGENAENLQIKEMLFGVGGGNFPVTWAQRYPVYAWWLYQPVHNVPFLILSEIGLMGFIGLIWLLYKIDQTNYRALPGTVARTGLMAGSALAPIAFFDHYLWSLWSGLALAALVLGITWQLPPQRQKN